MYLRFRSRHKFTALSFIRMFQMFLRCLKCYFRQSICKLLGNLILIIFNNFSNLIFNFLKHVLIYDSILFTLYTFYCFSNSKLVII